MFQRILAGLLAFSFFLPIAAHASTAPWAAEVQSRTGNGKITMTAGEVRELTVAYKNTGTSTWKNDGPGYISLYTHSPKYRTSAFDPGTWLSPTQVLRLREPSVAPGGSATLAFQLRAPSTPGVYTETFWLAAEDRAWLTGGSTSWTITVTAPASTPAAPVPTPAPVIAPVVAEIVAQSATTVAPKPGKPATVQVAIKNAGSSTWKTVALGQPHAAFAHSSWTNDTVTEATNIAAGATANLSATLLPPAIKGTHTAALPLLINGQPTGQAITIKVIVREGSSGRVIEDSAPVTPEKVLLPEPRIRVGVLLVDEETNNEVIVTSTESSVEVRTAAGQLLETLSPGSTGRVAYANNLYEYGTGRTKQTFSEPLRFIATTPNAILTITNFDRRRTRGTQFANNLFRDTLEIRYNPTKNRAWLINELGIESYLKGLAEAGNSHPAEFQKALNVAARSYAYFQMTNGGAYKKEGFDVDAYRDQVYWGAEHESRQPKIAQAVEATRGQIITYQGAVAITSYFSRSDGRTRNWSDVWFGDRPYARAVPVPCDQGKTMNGHGVGMSLSGAICMANAGQTMSDILTYFYTGIAIEQAWK